MDLTSPTIIKQLLGDTHPNKRLGQNFLIDKNVLRKIIEAADIKSTDTILEVGPGIGTLTKELAEKASRVIAIEKDPKMVEILKETLKSFNNVEIIQGDILKINAIDYQLQTTNYKLVANIPYYLTSPLIRKFLEDPPSHKATDGQGKNPPQEIILMIQKEVAQRICAKPPKMSLLAVSVQFYAEPKIISYVSKNCFLPAPKVDSAIIKIVPQKKQNISSDLFFTVVKAGFSQPRKQLVGNLSKNLKINKEKTTAWMLKNKVEPNKRAEALNIDDWMNLTKSFQ